jgi:hypothetical protein
MAVRLEQPKHLARQKVVADRLAAKWRCEWGQMGPYSPFDVYMLRERKVHALVEIRTRRDIAHDSHPYVLIDLDKWFHLMQCEIGLQLPGLYAVAFTDGIYYVRIGALPVNDYRLLYCGRKDRPEAANDMSPVVQVPNGQFRWVDTSEGVFED